MSRRKYYFKHPVRNISKERADEYLDRHIFTSEDFDLHIKRAAENLKLDEVIVRDVVTSFWRNVFYLINTVRKTKTKINIYGYFSIEVEKGDRF